MEIIEPPEILCHFVFMMHNEHRSGANRLENKVLIKYIICVLNTSKGMRVL